MDAVQIGTVLGATLAALMAGLGLTRHARSESNLSKIQEDGSLKIKELETTALDLRRSIDGLKEDLERDLNAIRNEQAARSQDTAARLQSIDTTLRSCVTDDEFQTYCAATNNNINGLTDKVGRATGILEATLSKRA